MMEAIVITIPLKIRGRQINAARPMRLYLMILFISTEHGLVMEVAKMVADDGNAPPDTVAYETQWHLVLSAENWCIQIDSKN